MPVNINGTTGVTTPGLDSTSMPTSGGDPVVESGSNSDGQWTKWADGTQTCYAIKNIDWTSTGRTILPLPLIFEGAPATFFAGITGTNTDYWQSLGDAGMQSDGSSWVIVKNTSNAFTLDVRLGALGRWK